MANTRAQNALLLQFSSKQKIITAAQSDRSIKLETKEFEVVETQLSWFWIVRFQY